MASAPATSAAGQDNATGTVQPSIVIGHPASARTRCTSATTANTVPLTTQYVFGFIAFLRTRAERGAACGLRRMARWRIDAVRQAGCETGASFPGSRRVAGRRQRRGLQAASLAQRLAQHVFDLRVDATQLVVGPTLHRVENLGRDAQRVG